MSETKPTTNSAGLIYTAIPAIMAEIPAIYKDRKNDQQEYSFRGIDDVYNAINPLLSKHGVFMKAEVLEKNLSTLVNFFESQNARLACTPTIWPTLGWVTSGFGPRTDPFTGKPAFHYGLDIATNMGNPIYATADGTVIQVNTDKMSGKSILINHGNNVATGYLHLDTFLVREGQRIRRGDIIGLVGRTGKALGPHLHYEIRINGIPQNPYLYILEE